MKIVSLVLMFLFFAFLSTPTVVTLIEKNSDVSLFYNFSEEEIHKEYKLEYRQCYDTIFSIVTVNKKVKIISENFSIIDKLSNEIFSPPPEFF